MHSRGLQNCASKVFFFLLIEKKNDANQRVESDPVVHKTAQA